MRLLLLQLRVRVVYGVPVDADAGPAAPRVADHHAQFSAESAQHSLVNLAHTDVFFSLRHNARRRLILCEETFFLEDRQKSKGRR